MSSRPRPAALPAEGGPSSWSFVIRASATELVRAPAGLRVGGPLADSIIVTVVELYDRLGTADEVSLSRQHFVILRELANKMMLRTAADALAAEQAPDTLH